MNEKAIPVMRFDIEGMKASIFHHLGVVGSELGKALDEEITKAVESFPWESRTKEIVHEAIESQIKSYFQYGEGAEAIKKTINTAITNHIV